MADKVHLPREAPGPAGEPTSGGGAPQFGLTAAMALIVGSIIGVGVFNLPTSLAAYGLDVRQWLICLAVALSIVVVSEIRKAVVRRRTVSSHPITR